MPSVFDHPLISERYFFPRPDAPSDLTEVKVEGATLACRLTVRDPDALTLVFFHGNGEVIADYVPDFEEMLLQLGVNVMFAEYRGYGASTGRPELARMLDDVTDIVAATGTPPEKLVAFGRSVGSIYAIELINRFPNAAGLILESGIADPLERVLLRATPAELGVTASELDAEAERCLNHRAKLERYSGPALILHAHGDELVHRSHAERNHEWLGGEQKRLLIFTRGGHNSVLALNTAEYLDAVADFLEALPS